MEKRDTNVKFLIRDMQLTGFQFVLIVLQLIDAHSEIQRNN